MARRPAALGFVLVAGLWLAAAMASVVCFDTELTARSLEPLLMQDQGPQELRPEPKRDPDTAAVYALSLV